LRELVTFEEQLIAAVKKALRKRIQEGGMKEENGMGAMPTGIQYDQQTKSFPLPWDRFWARCIDLLLHLFISFLMYFLLGVGSCMEKLVQQTSDINFVKYIHIINFIIIWSIVSAVFLFYESFFLSIFGATPGKALFRIKVTGSDGSKLSFGAALVRAIYVYWFGHYFYLFTPDAYTIGYWFSSRYYKKTGTFRWNKASGSTVNQEALATLRRKLLILLAVFCLMLREIPLLVFLGWLFKPVIGQ
jgi:uncharacterized RDD family membrane protein YckC